MKTPTIHFMDWAVVRTDNTGLINETGLVSRGERRGHKSATGDGIQGRGGTTGERLLLLLLEEEGGGVVVVGGRWNKHNLKIKNY